jgi:hypothetical protein
MTSCREELGDTRSLETALSETEGRTETGTSRAAIPHMSTASRPNTILKLTQQSRRTRAR